MSEPLLVPVATRGWIEAPLQEKRPARGGRARSRRGQALGEEVLVIDTETTAGLHQDLLLGGYRLFVGDAAVDEGLFLADDAPVEQRRALAAYVASHPAELAPGLSRPGLGRRLRVLSRSGFLRDVFYPTCYRRAGTLVGYDLPFALSRLARWCKPGPATSGGWILCLLGTARGNSGSWHDWPGCPGIVLRRRGEQSFSIEFRSQSPKAATVVPRDHGDTRVPAVVYGPSGAQYKGRMVDLAQVLTALSAARPSRAGACQRLGVAYHVGPFNPGRLDEALIEHLRAGLSASAGLWRGLQPEIERHADAGVPAHRLFSPASLARGYLTASGIDRGPKLDPQVAAYGAAAFSGGRVEARVVRHVVPVAVADRSAAYVRDAVLLGLEDLLGAERLSARDATAGFQAFLAGSDLLASSADQQACRWLARLLVEVRPGGEPWAVRAFFADRSAPSLTTAPFFFDGAWWVSAFDVLAAALLGRGRPKVTRALELVAHGTRPRQAIRVAGGEPATAGLFACLLARSVELAEEESALGPDGFKAMRNSACFGLLAQVSRLGGRNLPRQAWGPDGPREVSVKEERAGRHTCVPLAAALSAFARFLLARVEAKVCALGGVVAAMDTDSVAVVATPEGGPVSCPGGSHRLAEGADGVLALSFDQLAQILCSEAWADPLGEKTPWREKFDSLHHQAYLLAVANKRTAVFRRGPAGEVVLLDASEHALGGRYLSPEGSEERAASGARAWVEEAWRHLIDPGRHPEPWWSDTPAVRRVSPRRPEALGGLGPQAGLRPFGSYCQAEAAPLWGDGPGPVAPFSSEPADWCRWRDPRSARAVPVVTEAEVANGRASEAQVIATLGGVLERWWASVDHRYEPVVAPEPGRPPVGLLRPRAVTTTAALVELVGKESTLWRDALAGVVEPDDPEWLSSFGSGGDAWSEIVLPALARIGVSEAARRGGLHERKVRELISGRARPRASTSERMIALAYTEARAGLGRPTPMRARADKASPRAMLATVAAWLAEPAPVRLCERSGCPKAVAGKKRFCSERCRKAAKRAEHRSAPQRIGPGRPPASAPSPGAVEGTAG